MTENKIQNNEPDLLLLVLKFINRIKYRVIIPSLIIGAIVFYFSQLLPKEYTVQMSLYTGIASTEGLDENATYQDSRLKNTFENIINLTKSTEVLERVAIKLLSKGLVYGNPDEDNTHILSSTYKQVIMELPEEIKSLAVKDSLAATERNIRNYYEPSVNNHLFRLLNSDSPYFSVKALNKVIVSRVGMSDIIEIKYTSNDPGLTLYTVESIGKELTLSFEQIKYSEVNEIVSYFERELKNAKVVLQQAEANLVEFTKQNNIINYTEQTKAIAIAYTSYKDRLESVRQEYESSNVLARQLEKEMDSRAKLVKTNTKFVALLDSLALVNGRITELEIFNINNQDTLIASELQSQRLKLKSIESQIDAISDDINESKYTKEGILINTMAERWINEVLRSTKAKKELEILTTRRADFEEQYRDLSPIGAQLNAYQRDANIAEDAYLNILHGLNLAKLKQKNIQLTSSTLNVVSKPTYPLEETGSKSILLTLVSIIAVIVFIVGYYILKELLNRSLLNAKNAKKITGLDTIGAFTNRSEMHHRGYIRSCYRKSATSICNNINKLMKEDKTLFVNLVSTEKGEGKSFIAKKLYFKWIDTGFRTIVIDVEKCFDTDKAGYFSTANYASLLSGHINIAEYDVVILNFPPLSSKSVPTHLISAADINIVVANAERAWKSSDQRVLHSFVEQSNNNIVELCLNYCKRDAAEEVIGILPPDDIDSKTHVTE